MLIYLCQQNYLLTGKHFGNTELGQFLSVWHYVISRHLRIGLITDILSSFIILTSAMENSTPDFLARVFSMATQAAGLIPARVTL